jgi:hypothetical protein
MKKSREAKEKKGNINTVNTNSFAGSPRALLSANI